MSEWISIAAVVVSASIATWQARIALQSARTSERFAVAHAGAQSAMTWRDQVWALHDRGLDPEEIRWIMYAEKDGESYEDENGIIDEVVANVPRRRSEGIFDAHAPDPRRRIARPGGRLRRGDGEPRLD